MEVRKRIVLLLLVIIGLGACDHSKSISTKKVSITYPGDNTIFPADMSTPTAKWSDDSDTKKWEVAIRNAENEVLFIDTVNVQRWKPDPEIWETLKTDHKKKTIILAIKSLDNSDSKNTATINFSISTDSVAAPIFFRSVPLPFKFARENLKKINWHLGSISSEEKAPKVLSNIPVCGNCHSFSPDGKHMAMDVDARDEKGAYVISEFTENTHITQDKIINWSESQGGEFTYGLLSQISPNSRYVVSTLKDCEIFVDRKNMEYSQLFFPFKGILEIYDRKNDKYWELEGANDTNFVHSNPVWSPDGKYIYFCKAQAVHFEESGIFRGSKAIDHKKYNAFLGKFLSREKLFKFDIYRIPFNNGKGGKAEPVPGASNNNMSNYFPKISPDGKWMIFTQAESFMLLQKDSKLMIMPAEGGTSKPLVCNSNNMNSWHTWSPNSRWLAFSSKAGGPYTQLYLTHIDEEGNDSPAILLENMSFPERAVNIPEFVNVKPEMRFEIHPDFLSQKDFALRSAQIKNKNNELTEALAEFNAFIKTSKNNAEAYHGRGDVYAKLNKLDLALSDFNQAIKLNGNVADYYLSRGIVLGNMRDFEAAYANFEKAIELDEYSFMAYNDMAVLKVREGRIDAAIADYEKSLQLNPDAAMTYVNRGAAYAIRKNYNAALADFEKAMQLKDNFAMPYVTRSMMKQEQRNIQGAIDDLNIAIDLEPNNINVLQRRAKLHLKQQNYNFALEDLDRIINLDPENGEIYFNKAMVLIQLQEMQLACVNLNMAKAKGYGDADNYLREYCN